MAHHRFRARCATRLCVALLASLLCVPVLADEPPRTLVERMDRELKRFGVQVQLTGFRLRQGLVGAFGGEVDPGEPLTPVRACCSVNLTKLRGAAQELAVVLEELERCHRAAENHAAVSALAIARNDLGEFSRGLQILADAPTEEEADGAVAGLTRLYFGLTEGLEGMEDCPGQQRAAPGSEAEEDTRTQKEKKKDKKERKKKQEAEEESVD